MGNRRAGDDAFHADEDQVAAINRYAAGRANVVFLPPELDVSGGAPIEHRPSLLEAILGVERGEYHGVVVANLKRLTRSRSGHLIWERVEGAGGRVHCARENLDTSTVSGRRMRDYSIADAVAEREEHSEQHAERRRKTVEAGVWRQKDPPLGYQFVGPAVDGRCRGQARKLVPSDRADDVRRAFRARAAGVPQVQIADRLGMTPSGARHLLKNDVYLGVLRDGDNVNAAAHPPLITRDEFDAAQRPTSRPPRSAGAVAPALLAGVIRCAGCGHVMTRKRTARVVYGCAEHHSGARCPAPASITAAIVDAYVEKIALAELERLSVSASDGNGVEVARRRLADAKDEMSAFLKFTSARDEGFVEGRAIRREAIEAAELELRAELGRARVIPAGGSGADIWIDLDVREQNQLLRSLVHAVVVERAGGRGVQRPVEDRVRVLAHGSDVRLAERRGGAAAGIVPVRLPDFDDPDVLRVPSGEDAL